MIVISHRGIWENTQEKNTLKAFQRSFECGLGVEFDLRDQNGVAVVSHDMPQGDVLTFNDFLELYSQYAHLKLGLAINIKADGLQQQIKKLLDRYEVDNYYVFDMSAPDALGYLKKDLKVYTRQSEYEKNPSFYNESSGVWLDEFYEQWITKEQVLEHLTNAKEVCIVSPELHGREHESRWRFYKEISSEIKDGSLSICTDYPIEAKRYFNGKN